MHPDTKQKKRWFQKWWVWILLLVAVIITITAIKNTVDTVKEFFIPNVSISLEESLGGRTEGSLPLGVFNIQITSRSSGNLLTVTIRKNSNTPEQGYIKLDIEMYDKKGRPIGPRMLDTSISPNTGNNLLSFGDEYDFEFNMPSDATQFKIITLSEISLEDHIAAKLNRILADTEYYLRSGNFSKTRELLDEAITIKPDDSKVLSVLDKLESAEEAANNNPPEISDLPETIDTHGNSAEPGTQHNEPDIVAPRHYYDVSTNEWRIIEDEINPQTDFYITAHVADSEEYIPALGFIAKGVKLYVRVDTIDETNNSVTDINYDYIGAIEDCAYDEYVDMIEFIGDEWVITGSDFWSFTSRIKFMPGLELDGDDVWYWDNAIYECIYYIRKDDPNRLKNKNSKQISQQRFTNVDTRVYASAEDYLYPGVTLYIDNMTSIEHNGVLLAIISDMNGKIIGISIEDVSGDIWFSDINWVYVNYVRLDDPCIPGNTG